jgi:hypothetical protein
MAKAKVVEDFENVINTCDKTKRAYWNPFSGSWGVYGEFRGEAPTKPVHKKTYRQGKPTKVFGRDFSVRISERYAAKLNGKFAYMTQTAGCREFLQDELWYLMEQIGKTADLKSHVKATNPDIFRETSAYTNKSYKGRKGYTVLNGGLYTVMTDQLFDKVTEAEIIKQVKLLDLFVGIPFTLLDQYQDSINKKRYAKKGIAGRYILDRALNGYNGKYSHYFLYLVPGNVLMKAPWVPSFGIGIMRYMRPITFAGNTPIQNYISKLVNFKEVRNAIRFSIRLSRFIWLMWLVITFMRSVQLSKKAYTQTVVTHQRIMVLLKHQLKR